MVMSLDVSLLATGVECGVQVLVTGLFDGVSCSCPLPTPPLPSPPLPSLSPSQLLSWEDEPEKILEDENDELYSNSIRMSALDLVHVREGVFVCCGGVGLVVCVMGCCKPVHAHVACDFKNLFVVCFSLSP